MTRIYPFNKHIFTDDNFAICSVTNRNIGNDDYKNRIIDDNALESNFGNRPSTSNLQEEVEIPDSRRLQSKSRPPPTYIQDS